MAKRLLRSREVLALLKIKPENLRYHVLRGNIKRAERVSHANWFDPLEVARFKRERRSPGRPAKKVSD
jgi:hypothetical protein